MQIVDTNEFLCLGVSRECGIDLRWANKVKTRDIGLWEQQPGEWQN